MDMIRYHPGMITDYTATLATQAARLENNATEATNLVAAMADTFDTLQGSGAHMAAQQHIAAGIQSGREVMARHGSVVDNSLNDFIAQDAAAASAFGGI